MNEHRWAAVGKLLTVIFLMMVLAVAVLVIAALRSGISARTEPTAAESMLALTARRMATPARAHRMRNPIPLNATVLAEGRDHFADHCASCHANDGSGRSEMGRSLWPRVPDMRAARTQELSDGEIFYIIQNGVRLTGMPAWGEGGAHDEEDSWKLVHFIRHLPKITAAELDEMRAMNPISAHESQEQQEEDKFLKGDQKNEKH